MIRWCWLFSALVMVVVSCSSTRNGVRNVNAVAELTPDGKTSAADVADPLKILERHTVEFKIPNPLADQGMTGIRRVDPSHESQIFCKATLLDSLSTEADIAAICARDSLGETARAEFRKNYLAEHVRNGQFRVRISMESGFSPKSLDPTHWVIYLENAKGIALEPTHIISSIAKSQSDSIYSSYHRMSLPRTLIRGDITLYFNRMTFFREDLLGPANAYIVLEMVQEKRTVARVAWKRTRD